MAIIWTEDADSRQNTGPSGIQQQNGASFGASDYVPGGYPVYASAFGLSHIRALIPCAYTGTAGAYTWAYIKPAISGPSATNPGYLKVYGDGGPTSGAPSVEVSASTNFQSSTVDFMAYGY